MVKKILQLLNTNRTENADYNFVKHGLATQ